MHHTGAGIGLPSRAAMMFSAAKTAMAVRVFTVALPTCGSNTENKACNVILQPQHCTECLLHCWWTTG